MNITYKNTFFEGAGGANNPYARRYITGTPLETDGDYTICESMQGLSYDIVKGGECVGMNAGINGARRRVAILKANQ